MEHQGSTSNEDTDLAFVQSGFQKIELIPRHELKPQLFRLRAARHRRAQESVRAPVPHRHPHGRGANHQAGRRQRTLCTPTRARTVSTSA